MLLETDGRKVFTNIRERDIHNLNNIQSVETRTIQRPLFVLSPGSKVIFQNSLYSKIAGLANQTLILMKPGNRVQKPVAQYKLRSILVLVLHIEIMRTHSPVKH